MIKSSGLIVVSALLLNGCVHQPEKTVEYSAQTPAKQNNRGQQSAVSVSLQGDSSSSADTQPVAASPALSNGEASRIQQCRKELDAIRLYSKASYDKYLAEFQRVGVQTSKYMQIKNSIGQDINDLAMPRYEFQVRELCFRIKNRLSQLIIRQFQ